MTTSTTRAELESILNVVNHALVCHGSGQRCTRMDQDAAYTIEYAYGRPRLMRAHGSVDVSPRLSTGELAQWMRAFVAGIDAARHVPEAPAGGMVFR